MNKAGAGIAQAVTKFFQKPGRCIVFAGKGHNAGDALFAAQCLEQRGWKIEVRLAFKEADCSDLTRKKLGDLCRRPPKILGAVPSKTANKSGHHVYRTLAGRHRPDNHDAGFNPDRRVFSRCCSARHSGWFARRWRKTTAPRADPRRLSRHQSIANNKGRLRLCGGSSNWSRYRFRQGRSRLRSRRFYRYDWLREARSRRRRRA